MKHIELHANAATGRDAIADYVIEELSSYEKRVLAKFKGAGIPHHLAKMAPQLCARLWAELDIVPLVMHPNEAGHDAEEFDAQYWEYKVVDEQADSMARKCIR